nr:carboxypeptidase regulatory-like domain-containing protein [Chthoniobacterales bacterium]
MPADPDEYDKTRSMRYRGEEVEAGEKNKDPIRAINLDKVPDLDGALSLQNHDMPTVLPPPSLVFDGVSNSDNATLFGFRISPPDTVGDVGPNHYVQVVNLALRIFNKNGTPAGPAVKFSTIFAPLGTPASLRDDGDPIVLYDPMADRWMLSQFAFPTGTSTPPYHQVIAVSKTPDPTGPYYIYDFIVSNGNNQFNDYPHFGVWPDGYYMADNQFLNGGSFDGAGVFAFDRVKMLKGDPNAGFIYFNRNLASFPEGQGGMLPADMDGVRPPPPGTPCPFAYFVANEFGDPRDGMRIFDFRADFDTPANSTFTERPESAAFPLGGIAVAAFNPLSPTGRDDVPQPPPASNTTARLDAISDRLMHRLQYVNFGTHESLVTTHTVNVGPDQTLANYRAGVRYYQFRKNPGNNPYTVFDQGTHAPADTTHRWMGSAAINASGDLAVGFSASSLSVFPSIRYAARYGTDPLGSLAQGEQEIFTGTGVQTSTSSRWGDYSNLSVDPVDDNTFWFTQETYTAASQATSTVGWITKIAKFSVGGANTPFPKGTISGTITSCANGQPVADAVVQTNTGFFTTTNASGLYTLPKMAPGTVNVMATKQSSGATMNNVVVTNGNTTTVNLCLVPTNLIVKADATIVSAGANGVLDPGETVTVAFGVQNIGGSGACTAALTGTLQAGGGVTNPSGPQNFGATCSGSAPVYRAFTFTVDP